MIPYYIRAIADGVVFRAWRDLPDRHDDDSAYGNRAYIRHPSGEVTLYAHLATLCVRSGQVVKQGEIIGTMGMTGTDNLHLHLSYFRPGVREYMSYTASDPAPFIRANIMPAPTKACNPFGSAFCNPKLKAHEGIDFSGLAVNFIDSGIIPGLIVNDVYESRLPGGKA